jgi:hypothetical protein
MERYIFFLSNGTSFVNFDAILRKLQLFSDGRLEEKNLCIENFLQFLNQHSMTSKTVSRIFPVMFQSLLKPHYVHTAWLHKSSPNLIVCRNCSINSIRNPRQCFADNRSKNNIYQNQASRGTMKKFYLSGQIIVDLWFKVNPEVFPWHICDLYSRKWGTKRKITTFGIFPLQFMT